MSAGDWVLYGTLVWSAAYVTVDNIFGLVNYLKKERP